LQVVQFQMLSPDWKKAAFLLADRSVEFHSQFGKHYVTRIPVHGRCLAYQRETCEVSHMPPPHAATHLASVSHQPWATSETLLIYPCSTDDVAAPTRRRL
jgi:hypothetical protein